MGNVWTVLTPQRCHDVVRSLSTKKLADLLLSLQAKLVGLDADLWKTCYEDQESKNPAVEGY
jgi:hypothetical protein